MVFITNAPASFLILSSFPLFKVASLFFNYRKTLEVFSIENWLGD